MVVLRQLNNVIPVALPSDSLIAYMIALMCIRCCNVNSASFFLKTGQ